MAKYSRRFCLNCKTDRVFVYNYQRSHSFCEKCGGWEAMRKDYYFELRHSVINQVKEAISKRLVIHQETISVNQLMKILGEMTVDKRDTEDFGE